MKFTVILAVALLFITVQSGVVIPHLGPATGKEPKRYKVDINAKGKEKWEKIIPDYKEHLQKFIHDFKKLIPLPQFMYNIAGWYGDKYFKYQDYVEEMKAIAELSGIDYPTIFTLNFLYEIGSWKMGCTSLIFRDFNNTIVHGRNLDFAFFNYFGNLTTVIDFVDQNDNIIYSGDFVVGAVFFHTGVKHGKFGISVDERHTGSIWDNFKQIVNRKAYPGVWFLNEVMRKADSFDEAVKMLKEEEIASPIYYIVSGNKNNEGVIIEKDRNFVNAVYQLDDDEHWFLVQTNYDRVDGDPWFDDRKDFAEGRLRKLGPNLSEQDVMDKLMAQWPNFNIATILSTIIVPERHYFNTTTWY